MVQVTPFCVSPSKARGFLVPVFLQFVLWVLLWYNACGVLFNVQEDYKMSIDSNDSYTGTLDLKLDAQDKAMILNALEFRRAALIRARGKEVPGSDIYRMRTEQIKVIGELMLRYEEDRV